MYTNLIMIKQMRWQSFSSQMCKVHVWSVSTKGIQMWIIMSITVSKVTTNLTRHDHKLIKTLHKWKIMIWTIRYNKTEDICTKVYWSHALLWVILTKWSHMRLPVSWTDNQESENYKYPHGMETNDIARKWGMENLERYGDQWASSKVCQGMPHWYWICWESKWYGNPKCKYCLSISLPFGIIGVWKHIGIAHGMIMETTAILLCIVAKGKSK